MISVQKFQELFQFESSDLDFGIYRLLNKRDRIKFIEKDLKDKSEEALSRSKDERLCSNINKVEKSVGNVIQNLEQNTFIPFNKIMGINKDLKLIAEKL
ncbi:MAG: hypothetical protein QXF09_06805 [Nitrososphaerota archaeon]